MIANNTSAYDALKPQHRLWVDCYCRTWNQTLATMQSGFTQNYDSARTQGSVIFAMPNIQRALAERFAAIQMSTDELLARQATLARGTISPFIAEDGTVDLTSEDAKNNLHLIRRIRTRRRIESGEDNHEAETVDVDIEIHDPQRAIETLARVSGLLRDRQEQNITIDISAMTERVIGMLQAAQQRALASQVVDVTPGDAKGDDDAMTIDAEAEIDDNANDSE